MAPSVMNWWSIDGLAGRRIAFPHRSDAQGLSRLRAIKNTLAGRSPNRRMR
jgi:hypothetical protein